MNTYDKTVRYVTKTLWGRTFNSTEEGREFIGDRVIASNDDISEEMIRAINYILCVELSKRIVVDGRDLARDIDGLSLWKGDITALKVGAIVNAANSQGLGCFISEHRCIDNVIHRRAGPGLRRECRDVMRVKKKIDTSDLIITGSHMLPCDHILHTVGPIWDSSVGREEMNRQLAMCYVNCLNRCRDNGIGSIAFCCISTGLFGFPKNDAALVAVDTVKRWLKKNRSSIHVIFCVYSDGDHDLYKRIMR